MKKHVKSIALMMSAGLVMSNAPFTLPLYNVAAEELIEEDVETSDEEEVSSDTGAAAQEEKSHSAKSSLSDNVSLIEDPHPTSGGGLPDGLGIASSVRSRFESYAIVNVDPSQYPAASFSENAREVYWYCRLQLGLNHAAACGVLGNVQLESNFRPLALGDGGTSYGICQWHLGRCTNLMAYCNANGLDYNTIEGQLAYMGYEFRNGYYGVYEKLFNVPDTEEGARYAGWIMCVSFEIPDQADARGQQRGNLAANNYYSIDFFETATFKTAVKVQVREEADTSSEIITRLEDGAKVSLLEVSDGWAKVTFLENGDTKTGYVPAEALTHIKESEELSAEKAAKKTSKGKEPATDTGRKVKKTEKDEAETETETESKRESVSEDETESEE